MDYHKYLKNLIRAVGYIEKHIKEKISIRDAAASAYMSKDNFWRIFKKIFGESVISYIRKRRLTIIAEKLHSSRKDATKLCFEYGFESKEVFFRSFKKHFGLTPAGYRSSDPEWTRHLKRSKIDKKYVEHIIMAKSHKKKNGK